MSASRSSITAKQEYLASKYLSGAKADAIISRVQSVSIRKKTKTTQLHQETGFLRLHDEDKSLEDSNSPTELDDDVDVDTLIVSDRSFKKRDNPINQNASDGWLLAHSSQAPSRDLPSMPRNEIAAPSHAQKSNISSHHSSIPSAQVDTVYRDRLGRKIDPGAMRVQEAHMRRIEDERTAARTEWGKGQVQRIKDKAYEEELILEKIREFARHADNKELNEQQKQELRWNDPAAMFLLNHQSRKGQYPQYSGPPPPPNRFMIKPGHRWDGVDRSNGYEMQLFQKVNQRSQTSSEAYEWRIEDM